jgi:hypothetical protein
MHHPVATDAQPPAVRVTQVLQDHRPRTADSGQRAAAQDDVPEDFTPVMTQLSAADLATLDTLITAGIVNSRAEGVRWAVGRLREHPAYTRLQQQIYESNELKTQF